MTCSAISTSNCEEEDFEHKYLQLRGRGGINDRSNHLRHQLIGASSRTKQFKLPRECEQKYIFGREISLDSSDNQHRTICPK